MKKLFTIILAMSFITAFAQLEGTTWKMSPQAAALGVGPELGNISWWSNSAADITTRACYFDDEYVFHADGTFENVQQDQSWIEPWQGMDPESCGTPVAPHDGSNAATWTYDAGAGTITLNGVGAYLGLAKVFNEGELTNPADAPASITYPVTFNATQDTMEINISIATGYWRYIMTTNAGTPPPPSDPLTLPITFDDADVDYSIVDFGGTGSSIIVDPDDANNKVLQTVRSDAAETWAGTTLGEPTGVTPAIPFSDGNTTMSIRVYSPEVGIPILFKLEVWDNTSVSVETMSNTTVANEWEVIDFDFSNEVEGTAPIDFANPYNKPVVFFNFGVPGAEAGEMTFMWDDVKFVDGSSIFENEYLSLDIYPNPASDMLSIKNYNDLSSLSIYSVTGQLVLQTSDISNRIDVSSFAEGVYSISAIGNDGQIYQAKFMVK